MKKAFAGLLFSILVLTFASFDANAEWGGPPDTWGRCRQDEDTPMMRPMRHQGRMMEQEHPLWRQIMGLGLDEKQTKEVKELRDKVMKETIKKRADERVARVELRDLLDNDPVDIKAVEAKLKQIEAMRTGIHLSLIRAKEEVKSKLTPEQRKKFQEIQETRPGMDCRRDSGPCFRDEG